MTDNHFEIILVIPPIEALREELHHCVDYFQSRKLLVNCNRTEMKTFCNKVYHLLGSHFVNGVYIVEKTKRRLSANMNSDDVAMLAKASLYAYSVLDDINSRIDYLISLSDFPSCKHLLTLDKEVIHSALKQISDNPMIKQLEDVRNIVHDASDAVTIIKVFAFYKKYIDELNREIREEHWALSQWEQWLLDKAQAECGYCYLAMLKLGFSIPHDISELMKETQANDMVLQYQTKWNTYEQQNSHQPIFAR